jgi:hypothetical protein
VTNLLDWLDQAPPVAAPPPPAPSLAWPGGARTADVRALAHGLEVALGAATVEKGDAADQALDLVRAWRKALADHPKHGFNWFSKNRSQLEALLRQALPGLLTPPKPEREYEGRHLVQLTLSVFPGAMRGPQMGLNEAPSWRGVA